MNGMMVADTMLVGAVTPAFVNDPTQGYGIFSSRMLESQTLNEAVA